MGSAFTAFSKVSLQASACFFIYEIKIEIIWQYIFPLRNYEYEKQEKGNLEEERKKLYWCCIQNKTCAKIYSKEQDYYLSIIIKQFKNE